MTDEIKPIETRYDDHRFRSRTEARWAVFFNALGLEYHYEKEGYDLEGDWYLPDFHLPAFPMWLEVKGAAPSDREIELCKRLSRITGERVLLAIGAPRAGAANLIQFADGEREDGIWALEADRRNEGEYWLTSSDHDDSEYTGMSIGPVSGPAHDRYPLVHGRLAEAFTAAQSARFEHGEEG